MPARPSCGVVCLAALAACSAGNNSVDPGDLELRDVLGIAPEVAAGWDGAQRAAARRVLEAGLREDDAPSQRPLVDPPAGLDERIAELLAAGDAARAADGAEPLGMVRVVLDTRALAAIAPRRAPLAAAALGGAEPPGTKPLDRTASRATALGGAGSAPAPVAAAVGSAEPPHAMPLGSAEQPHTAPPGSAEPPASGAAAELWLSERWDAGQSWSQLPGRGAALLAALAGDAGHPGGPAVVVPAPRLAVIAAYVRVDGDAAPPRLAVNPVVLAALEPVAGEAEAAAAMARWSMPPATASAQPGAQPPVAGPGTVASTGGNPYSFYGSVAECALAQRTRCEACLPAGTCRPITNISDGNAECTMLGADDGRGYFLMCINLALAITSIDRCAGDDAPTCVRDPHAADTLATLENNADFLADPTCGDALDGCLAKIFGPPQSSFPGLDAGTAPGGPPRSTSVSCGNSCNNNQNTSCNASPSCDCSGPSCNNSLSCDSACSSSNDQSGCGGNCNACSSSGGGGGNGGGGCGGGSSSSSGGGCSSSSGSSSSSGCGGGSGSGGGCSGGGCSSGSGGSCGGGGCSGSGGSCNSSSSGGKCSVAPVDPGPGIGLAMSALWGGLPIALAAFTRRRARRRARSRAAADADARVAGSEAP